MIVGVEVGVSNPYGSLMAAQVILQEILAMRPRAVIIDSIQTVYLDDVTGSSGSVSQVQAHRAHPCSGSQLIEMM